MKHQYSVHSYINIKHNTPDDAVFDFFPDVKTLMNLALINAENNFSKIGYVETYSAVDVLRDQDIVGFIKSISADGKSLKVVSGNYNIIEDLRPFGSYSIRADARLSLYEVSVATEHAETISDADLKTMRTEMFLPDDEHGLTRDGRIAVLIEIKRRSIGKEPIYAQR